MSRPKYLLPTVAASAVLLAAAGCTGIGKYNVRLGVNPALQSQSVQVDVIGVNDTNYAMWEQYSMGQYWSPGDKLRVGSEGAKVTFYFGLNREAVQTLPISAEKWKQWKSQGCRHLFVLADLGAVSDAPGEADPRRLILPLETHRWRGRPSNPIRIQIRESGIACETPPKPEKK